VEGEKNPVDRCHEIINEGNTQLPTLRILFTNITVQGGCEVDKSYAGPKLTYENGKHSINQQFIKDMIQWFKNGKTLPKRYVWEIVFGAHEHFAKEESLVNVGLHEGVTCDVIGDVHGMFLVYWPLVLP